MQLRDAYLERVQAELEDLAARIAVVKARIVQQKVDLTLEQHWQVVSVRNRFRDFKRRVDELEEASEENLEEAGKASELAWKDLQQALCRRFCPRSRSRRAEKETAPGRSGLPACRGQGRRGS